MVARRDVHLAREDTQVGRVRQLLQGRLSF